MNGPSEPFHVVPREDHNALVESIYLRRGYATGEARAAAETAADASWHGIRTHNAIKALHIEAKHAAHGGGSRPGVQIRRLPTRFASAEVWDAQRKLGQPVAREAIETCMQLADRFGVGQVSVDNACHYLWGGGYVLHAARRGFLAYTHCTAALAEVVPYQGRTPTLGTNPHSWAFPTQDIVGFPILVDWATSVIAMSRIDHCRRERQKLPPGAAIDAGGRPTVEPAEAVALLPFGGHKGYGLGLVNEIMAAFVGGSLPTLRNRGPVAGEKHTTVFVFQVIHPEALSGGAFARNRTQWENVRAVLGDIRGHGNEACRLPGEVEAEAAARSERNGGLLFSAAEITELNRLAAEAGVPALDPGRLRPAG
ncbi:MAG TPA: Ldh family oxidoreductase [Candidatus Baltobacteraceae bacterium]|nr:Ldh family oxidoreductase [Candidatus Baltobacteraceae bacterium]